MLSLLILQRSVLIYKCNRFLKNSAISSNEKYSLFTISLSVRISCYLLSLTLCLSKEGQSEILTLSHNPSKTFTSKVDFYPVLCILCTLCIKNFRKCMERNQSSVLNTTLCLSFWPHLQK